MVAAGGKILAYAAGSQKDGGQIIGMADINAVLPWDRKMGSRYPLLMDGIADRVLILKNCKLLETPVRVKDVISKTGFAPKNINKWGVCFMGGARSLSERDYNILLNGISSEEKNGTSVWLKVDSDGNEYKC